MNYFHFKTEQMDINRCYNILSVTNNSSDEEVTRSFRAMAMKYHPDKNPDKREWANEQMTILNTAYSTLMSYRFKEAEAADEVDEQESLKKAAAAARDAALKKAREEELRGLRDEARREYLINKFVQAKESAKDAMYRYFQYSLYNFHRRDEHGNRKIYDGVTLSLRRAYHALKKLSQLTDDRELLDHFNVFGKLIFDFYRASECVNIIDSYNDRYEVDAYRLYRKGDDFLHRAQKELFFDRHNRGYIDRKRIAPDLIDAEQYFRHALRLYADSSWAVESQIKLEYIQSLKSYINLFFSEE